MEELRNEFYKSREDVNDFSFITSNRLAKNHYNRWEPIYACVKGFTPDINNVVRLMRTDELIPFEVMCQNAVNLYQANGVVVNSINDFYFYKYNVDYINCMRYHAPMFGNGIIRVRHMGLPIREESFLIDVALQLRKEYKIVIKGIYPSEDGTRFIEDPRYRENKERYWKHYYK